MWVSRRAKRVIKRDQEKVMHAPSSFVASFSRSHTPAALLLSHAHKATRAQEGARGLPCARHHSPQSHRRGNDAATPQKKTKSHSLTTHESQEHWEPPVAGEALAPRRIFRKRRALRLVFVRLP